MRNETLSSILPLVETHNIFVLLGDLGVHQCRDLFANYPLNIINYGIMEQSMVGVSAGLSSTGMYPVLYSITPFLIDRAYEQIKLDLVYNKNPCLIISAGAAYDYSKLGPTHYCPHDISALLLVGFPYILIPFVAEEAISALSYCVCNRYLSYLRLSSSSLDFSLYPWLTLVQEAGRTQHLPLKHWISSLSTNKALVVFSPDAQFLPVYDELLNEKIDVVQVCEISRESLSNLSTTLESYTELEIMVPFESSTLVEHLQICLSHRSNKLAIHTISNQYLDASMTKESIFAKLYVYYSFGLI